MTVYAAKKLISTYRLVPEFEVFVDEMLMLRAKPSESWLPKVMANLDAVLVDHAHLERKAATSALSLERYQELFDRVADLNAIAIEELEHFQLVLDILADRGVPFSHPISSPWISGLMGTIRKGRHEHMIDHQLCAALLEKRVSRAQELNLHMLGMGDDAVCEQVGGFRARWADPPLHERHRKCRSDLWNWFLREC